MYLLKVSVKGKRNKTYYSWNKATPRISLTSLEFYVMIVAHKMKEEACFLLWL